MKAVSVIMLELLLTSMLILAFNIKECRGISVSGPIVLDLNKLYVVLDADHGHIKELRLKDANTGDLTPVDALDFTRPFSAVASPVDNTYILGGRSLCTTSIMCETSQIIVVECKNDRALIVYSFYKNEQFFDIQVVGYEVWQYVLRFSFVPEKYATEGEEGLWCERQVVVKEPWIGLKSRDIVIAISWDSVSLYADHVTMDDSEGVYLPSGATAKGIDIGDVHGVGSSIFAYNDVTFRCGIYNVPATGVWYQPAKEQHASAKRLPNIKVFKPEISDLTVFINGVVSPSTQDTHIVRIHWVWGDGTEEDYWFPASHIYIKSGNYTITVIGYQSDGLISFKTLRVSIGSEPAPSPTILLLINKDIYSSIKSKLFVFEQDLWNEGYYVVNTTVSEETSPPEIREIIRTYYYSTENFVGAILIGNIKAAYTEIRTGDYSNPNALKIWISLDATDMYYMDLDGYWENVTHLDFYANKPSNVAEVHLYPSCQTFYNEYVVYPDETKKWDYWQIENKTQYKAEIWVSRIMAHNLKITSKNETEIINEFFDWDHNYRTGVYDISSKAYILNAIGPGYNEQGMDYSKIFDTIVKKENITKNAYITCLEDPNGSKLIYLTAHSWPQGHALYDTNLNIDELDKKNKTSIFYILNACSSCRWDQHVTSPTNPNYLGGLYVFDSEKSTKNHGLGAIGFTGVGGFNFLKFFTDYINLNPDTTYGEAYKYWFNNNLMHLFGVNNYVFLGDPTIGPKHPKEITHDIAIKHIAPYRTILGNNTSTSINITVQNQGTILETFNVSLYYDSIYVGTYTVTLAAHQSKVLTFWWKTPMTIGNYTIKAIAEPVFNENILENNEYIFSILQVSIIGDINGDNIVNIIDISKAARSFGSYPSHHLWDANADLNEDRIINIVDLAMIAKEFGKTI